jgi:hypothetical protein
VQVPLVSWRLVEAYLNRTVKNVPPRSLTNFDIELEFRPSMPNSAPHRLLACQRLTTSCYGAVAVGLGEPATTVQAGLAKHFSKGRFCVYPQLRRLVLGIGNKIHQ